MPLDDTSPDSQLTHALAREHRLTRLLALSFDGPSSPSLSLPSLRAHELRDNPYGWGFAWYPEQGPCSLVVKDPTSVGENALTKVLAQWERFESTTFVAHLRGAARSITEQDTQPFSRSFAGRDFVFAHNGDLFGDLASRLPLGGGAAFEPNGKSDSERAFCWVLEHLHRAGARSLSDLGYAALHRLFVELDGLGTANILLTDGRDLVAYQDTEHYNQLSFARLSPPHEGVVLDAPDLRVDLTEARVQSRTALVVATTELSGARWTKLEAGQMLVARRGAVVYLSGRVSEREAPTPRPAKAAPPRQRLHVTHETVYRYGRPVEHSEHLCRLRPLQDAHQLLLDHELRISVDGLRREFEDVFGNQATFVELELPYAELRLVARSLVELRTPVTAPLLSADRRHRLPVGWMPWQRQMMLPYLLPPELPEPQLRELNDYALSFADRQDGDVALTLLDINQTLHRDYRYVQGSTNLDTTPFEVYTRRSGVCQDFANLLICLARLLGIPARYRVGYIHTGASYANQAQGESSHAWAELYLPRIGWQGFDPTNACLAANDHVRVACGRNYLDATPTSGTLYKGGGNETLEITVRVEARETS